MSKADTDTPLAAGLRRALQESGWSARGLSLAAGLTPDAIRNILRGLSREPREDAVRRIADVLGVQEAVLRGEAPWPVEDALAPLAAAPAPSSPGRRARHGTLAVPEMLLLPANGPAAGHLVQGWPPLPSWGVPATLLEARGLERDGLAMLRAPSALPPEIAVGDPLLVDTSPWARLPSPPGTAVIHDGVGYVVARVQVVRTPAGPRARVTTSTGTYDAAPGEAGIVGRVVGRWTWL